MCCFVYCIVYCSTTATGYIPTCHINNINNNNDDDDDDGDDDNNNNNNNNNKGWCTQRKVDSKLSPWIL